MATVAEPRSHADNADGASGRYGPEGRSDWMDVDWNRHQRWLTVKGRPVNVIDLGTGDPIVYIHGLSGSWMNWLENLLPFANAGHRVVALDLPGFGASPMPAEKITIHGYAEIVADLLGQLDIDAACIVGNSMGGFIAAELALIEPHLVERLVLVSAAGITSQKQRTEAGLKFMNGANWILRAQTAWFASKSDWVARRPVLRKWTFGVVVRHPSWLPPALVAEQLRGSGKRGFVPALDALTSFPIEDRLKDIVCPTLVVWGAQDRIVPLRDADAFASAIEDSRMIVYTDTAHLPMLERPARFNADLRAFLADDDGDEVGHASAAAATEHEVARTGDPELDG